MAGSQQRLIIWKGKAPLLMVVRALLICILFTMLVPHAQTQESQTQSRSTLLHIFNTSTDAAVKARSALFLGIGYTFEIQDSAEFFFNEARNLIPETGHDSLYMAIYERSSILSEMNGDFRSALAYVYKTWSRVRQTNRTQAFDHLYILLGRYHMRSIQYDSAIYYWTLLKKNKVKNGDEYGQWLPHMYLGNLYADLGDWPKATENFDASLEILRKEKIAKDYLYLLYVYMNSAETIGDYNQYSKLKEEYLTFKQSSGQNILNPEHSMISTINETPADQRKKLFTYLPFHIRNKSRVNILETYYSIGQSYMREKNADKAIEAYRVALLYADSLAIPSIRFNSNLALLTAFESKKDYSNALQHFKTIYALRDTLFNIEKQKQMDEILVKYETAEKEKQLAETTVQLESSRQKQLFLTIGLFGMLLVAGLTYYAFRIKIKSSKLLEEKNDVISGALKEKDILLREIHHRVKNNLQMISALLYLHGKSVDDTSAQEALMESQNRVQSMAIIHQNLYQQDNLLGVEIPEYLDKLLLHLISSYNIEKDRIHITQQIEISQLDVDTVIPLALIINELISNALKYAFNDGRQGKIEVFLGNVNDQIVLEVKDNGIGMPLSESSKVIGNFGFKLINILSERLGGTVKTRSDGGTIVTLHIPVTKVA